MKYLILIFLLSELAWAEALPPREISLVPEALPDDMPLNVLSFSYSPLAKVKGDLPEDDVDGGDYSNYTLDTGTAKSLKWTYFSPEPIYLEYTTIDTNGHATSSGVDKFQSVTAGFGLGGVGEINGFFDLYGGVFVGAGGSRFDLGDIKYRALGEGSAEIGFLMAKLVSLGLGVKYQIVGYPSETMAEAWYLNLSLGLWF